MFKMTMFEVNKITLRLRDSTSIRLELTHVHSLGMAHGLPGTLGALRTHHLGHEGTARNSKVPSRDARRENYSTADRRGRQRVGWKGVEGD